MTKNDELSVFTFTFGKKCLITYNRDCINIKKGEANDQGIIRGKTK
jgi:hypothetical protein